MHLARQTVDVDAVPQAGGSERPAAVSAGTAEQRSPQEIIVLNGTDSPPSLPSADRSGILDADLKRGLRWLRFPVDIEQQFMRDTHEARSKHHLRMLVIALISYNSFVFMDRQLMPDIASFELWVRLAINFAAVIIVVAILYGLPYLQREMAIAVSGFVSGSTVPLFMIKSGSSLANLYCLVIPLFIIYSNVMQRNRFWYALMSSLGLLVVSTVSVNFVSSVTNVQAQVFTLMMVSTCLFTLAPLYKLEHDERAQYLMRIREHRLLAELGAANERLDKLSRTDALTTLANRRGFEEQLATSWSEMRKQHLSLSLVMLDIDYFKRYNDHYGHPGGDQCLRRVAGAIRAALRFPNDFAARYGGEEFAVILPRTDETMALGIAERIRQAVIGIDLLHEKSEVSKIVTISIGVATLRGDDTAMTMDALIKAADGALYDAKEHGRNRVAQWRGTSDGQNTQDSKGSLSAA
jgi:diguanylate cyclase (GGDEF)-like protein